MGQLKAKLAEVSSEFGRKVFVVPRPPRGFNR